MAGTRDQVIEIISQEMNVPKDKITDDTSFVNDLGADSLDTTELMLKFEDKFDFEIPEEDAVKIQTVGDAVRFIENYLEKNK